MLNSLSARSLLFSYLSLSSLSLNMMNEILGLSVRKGHPRLFFLPFVHRSFHRLHPNLNRPDLLFLRCQKWSELMTSTSYVVEWMLLRTSEDWFLCSKSLRKVLIIHQAKKPNSKIKFKRLSLKQNLQENIKWYIAIRNGKASRKLGAWLSVRCKIPSNIQTFIYEIDMKHNHDQLDLDWIKAYNIQQFKVVVDFTQSPRMECRDSFFKCK